MTMIISNYLNTYYNMDKTQYNTIIYNNNNKQMIVIDTGKFQWSASFIVLIGTNTRKEFLKNQFGECDDDVYQ